MAPLKYRTIQNHNGLKTYKGLITELLPHQVFVCGTNKHGRHGAGAAKQAAKFGAINGFSRGFIGVRCYGIVTKDLFAKQHPSISQEEIKRQIKGLYAAARELPHREFLIAYSATGTNLSGYTNEEMAEMFRQPPIPENIVFEEGFSKLVYGDENPR